MREAMMAPDPQIPAVTLVTLSFAGDLEPCRLLCETVDRFAPGLEHLIAVPKADLPLFRHLGGARRRMIAEEDLLPGWLFKLPMPGPAWRQRLRLPRRNVYVSLKGPPVRGWIAQQIMKFAIAAAARSEVVVHLDSDTAVIRPLGADAFVAGGLARLSRFPGAGDTPMHARWHRAASKLLGLPAADYHGADYVDAFVTWRRPVVAALMGRIAEVGGRDAVGILTRTPHFSEYVLYGVFCDRVLGISASGHRADAASPCATLWTGTADDAENLVVRPDQVGVCLQSTLPIAPQVRRRIVASVIAAAQGPAA